MYNTLEFMLYLDLIFTICFTPKTIQMDYDVCPSLQHIIDNKCYVLLNSNLIIKF